MTLGRFIDMLNTHTIIDIEPRCRDSYAVTELFDKITYHKMVVIVDNYPHNVSEWMVSVLRECPIGDFKIPNDTDVPLTVVVDVDRLDIKTMISHMEYMYSERAELLSKLNDMEFKLRELEDELSYIRDGHPVDNDPSYLRKGE